MSWTTTTLSTTTSIAKIENEINDLIESSGTNYMFNEQTIGVSGKESDTLDVSGGMIEIIANANSNLSIKDGEKLEFTISDSDDETGTYTSIYDGLILYSKSASGSDVDIDADTELFRWVVPTTICDYIKIKMESSAENTGTINIYSNSKWGHKIDTAKTMIKNKVETWLSDFGYKDFIDWDDGEELINLISNPSIFSLSSDLLTLHLIFRDLSTGKAEDHIWWQKSIEYKNDYEEELSGALRRINLDLDQDDDTDEYRKDQSIKLLI